jgi:hypothetical protein
MTLQTVSLRRMLAVLVLLMSSIGFAAGRASAAEIKLAWDSNTEPDIAGYVVQYGPASAPYSQQVDIGKVTTWTLTSATAGVSYTFRVVAYNTTGLFSDPSASVTAIAAGTVLPTMSVDRTALNFGVLGGTAATRTASQTVRLTQTGAGTVTWTAASNSAWLQVSPASGSGSGALTVSLVPAAVPASAASAAITVTVSGAANTIAPIPVSVKPMPAGSTTAPTGAVDSPANNITGVTGSLAITGWAVDDVDVTGVRILRDSFGAEPPNQLVMVGAATLVDDARPDVAAAYPSLPRNYRAGWGYLLLTNMLPGLGNGTFKFYAYADDVDGHSTLLGTRTVTVSNNSATLPFGTLDTPLPGETVGDSVYTSFGWVLARAPKRADVAGGGTVSVVVDGAIVPGTPTGWSARSDLSALFPAAQYPGITNAVAAFAFDTTALSNGVHTMAWVVTDNQGNAAGVGSRYFRVFNTTSAVVAGGQAAVAASEEALLAGGVAADRSSVEARRGYAIDAPFYSYAADAHGRVTIQAEEIDLIELRTHGATEGFLVAGDARLPLPIGSHLDPATGVFKWQPGVGFVGAYDLAFLQHAGGRTTRQDVRIVLNPKGSNRVGPQIVIDRHDGILAGWAADLDSGVDTGIDTLHVWAYPVNDAGRAGQAADPVFIGQASYGGDRPDVAAVYGEQFRKSGYGLRVEGLAPGTYDLAVFAWSTAKHGWLPAKVVRVTVR